MAQKLHVASSYMICIYSLSNNSSETFFKTALHYIIKSWLYFSLEEKNKNIKISIVYNFLP